MARNAFSIDLDRCVGCQACVVACKMGNERPLGSNYIVVHESVRGQMPRLVGSFVHHRCFHCADAACVAVCPTGALAKRDGLTAVDMDKCSGCGYCTDACPYKVPTLVDGRVSKCVACLDLVQEGKQPWCVQTCPSQAIAFGERDKLLVDAKARVAALKTRHVNAQVYGETQLGGLGLLMTLLDKPSVFGLPENPQPAAELDVWQKTVQPASIGISALSVVAAGLAFVVARRQHIREKAAMHRPVEPIAPPVKPALDEGKTRAPAEVAPLKPAQPSLEMARPAQVTSVVPPVTPALDDGKTQAPAEVAQPKPVRPPLETARPAQATAAAPAAKPALDPGKSQTPAADAQPKRAQPSGGKDEGGR
jgi:formate dehydrogenase iron-sulfur subunit